MYPGFKITPPFFELGPKAYLYGNELLKLAKYADAISQEYQVQVILTPQAVDISLIAANTTHLSIFAQHIDWIRIGRGNGSILPEAVKAAGATGTLLNHVEKKLSLDDVRKTIERADEVGLASMVCADNIDEAIEIAKMNPNIILVEAPKLIEAGKRDINDQLAIREVNQMIWDINPEILILHGGGISNAKDVYDIIKWGAQGTGSTSGVILSPNPYKMLEDMLRAIRLAWDELHNKENR